MCDWSLGSQKCEWDSLQLELQMFVGTMRMTGDKLSTTELSLQLPYTDTILKGKHSGVSETKHWGLYLPCVQSFRKLHEQNR